MFSTTPSTAKSQQPPQQQELSLLWTPMDCCMGATLTESGLLQRSSTEVELYTAVSTVIGSSGGGSSTTDDKCTIELRAGSNNKSSDMVPVTLDGAVDTRKQSMNYRDRTNFPFQMTITTHRIVFFRDVTDDTASVMEANARKKKREARYVHMSNVFSITVETFYFKSPKIILSTSMGEMIFAYFKSPSVATNPVKLRDDMYTNLMTSYHQKQWDIDDAMERQRIVQRKMIASTKVGVDAILSSAQQRHDHVKRITDRVFVSTTTPTTTTTTHTNKKHLSTSSSSSSDLDMFLMEATELVGVIQKYVATFDRSISSNNPDDDTIKLVGMLQDMGMTSILNKNNNHNSKKSKNSKDDTNDDIYYDTIARQVVDLIRPKLQRQNVPMITLTDVYCLYNRSRGTQLISPDDLLRAMQRLPYLQLNLSLLTFPNSGLMVVQDPSRTNVSTLTQTFLQMCRQNSGGYITAVSVSQHCHIPTILAYEQLQMVEQQCSSDTETTTISSSCSSSSIASPLVRDETVEVIRFYPNQYFC